MQRLQELFTQIASSIAQSGVCVVTVPPDVVYTVGDEPFGYLIQCPSGLQLEHAQEIARSVHKNQYCATSVPISDVIANNYHVVLRTIDPLDWPNLFSLWHCREITGHKCFQIVLPDAAHLMPWNMHYNAKQRQKLWFPLDRDVARALIGIRKFRRNKHLLFWMPMDLVLSIAKMSLK